MAQSHSETITEETATSAPARSRMSGIFRLRITAHALFGGLLIFDSLFLVICYVTVDFFGVLNSPLLGWLRQIAHIAWLLYFPAFAAALLSLEQKARKPAAAFILLQFAGGFALFFSRGFAVPLGWCMLYGPDLRTPGGDLHTYVYAIGCLFPLLWLSSISLASTRHAMEREARPGKWNLYSFLLAGAAAALVYASSTAIRLGIHALSLQALAFSLIAHLAIFVALFATLQWIEIFSRASRNPSWTKLLLQSAAGWLLLTIILRKIIFALLAFNSRLADFYAAIFSLTVVLWIVSLALRVKVASGIAGSSRKAGVTSNSWPVRILALPLVLTLAYLFTNKIAVIDWEHILGCVTALASWLLLLWLFSRFPGSDQPRTWKPLLALSLASMGVVVALVAMESKTVRSSKVDQYADSDPSFFVIEQFLRSVVHDESYSGFYSFLTKYANISPNMPMRDISLSDTLQPSTSPKPDIFLFVIDALRQDYVSPYNPSVGFTPAIQAFAQESVVFRHAYTPYAGTALAEPSIWSGIQEPHSPSRIPGSGHMNLQRMLDVDGYHCYISYDEILHAIVPASANVTALGGSSSPVQLKEFGAIVAELENDISKRADAAQPVFFYTQPANLHTLSLTLFGGQEATSHPGFNDKYASALEQVDKIFGGFIAFLKSHGLYENSIVILTADHGESLGEMGREGHVGNLTPEVLRVPLIIHIPKREQAQFAWEPERLATLHDITPTLYYLLGHHSLKNGPMVGHPLFTLTEQEQPQRSPDHYLLMSSYLPVFGILSGDEKNLFMVDATLRRNYFYDLASDPQALNNRITVPIRDQYEPLIRHDLEEIDKFYGLDLSRSH